MLFTVLKRNAGASEYALASNAAVAALARLREQTFPSIVVDLPHFTPRTRVASANPAWLGQIARQGLLALFLAAVVLAAAVAIPAILSARGSDTTTGASTLRSSVGLTGTAATTAEDFGIRSIVGGVPFVQQLNYYEAITASQSPVRRFVLGAQQAPLAEYLQDVGAQVALPYLNAAADDHRAIATWTEAVEKGQAEEARTAALRAPASPPHISWQATPVTPGTRLGATSTFYDCLGGGFCGTMASGVQVFHGAAACSTNLPFGTKFRVEGDPLGRVFTCLDRGALAPNWVDIWFYDPADGWAWQSIVGTRVTIVIV
jgi:hypothetical protein